MESYDNPNSQEINPNRKGGKKRLLCKNMNGIVLTTSLFEEIYPDAVFVGLVRHGLALCEGFLRRGWKTHEIAAMYGKICSKMIRDSEEKENYIIVRFEDLIKQPSEEIKKIYSFAGLNISQVNKFRLQAKPSMKRDGTREQTFGKYFKEMQWIEMENLSSKFRPNVNENQIAQLKKKDKQIFFNRAGSVMKQLGYDEKT